MRHAPTDIIWDLGFSDECLIFVMSKVKDRFVIVDKIEDKGKVVSYYLEKLLKYKDCNNHLPDDAFYQNFSSESVADVLKKNGFKVVY